MSVVKLVQDDSCHWYAIPADQAEQFYRWVEFHGSEDGYGYAGKDFGPVKYDGPDFDSFRLSSSPSHYEWVRADVHAVVLAALIQARDFYDNAGSPERFADGFDIATVRAAIAKAEGR